MKIVWTVTVTWFFVVFMSYGHGLNDDVMHDDLDTDEREDVHHFHWLSGRYSCELDAGTHYFNVADEAQSFALAFKYNVWCGYSTADGYLCNEWKELNAEECAPRYWNTGGTGEFQHCGETGPCIDEQWRVTVRAGTSPPPPVYTPPPQDTVIAINSDTLVSEDTESNDRPNTIDLGLPPEVSDEDVHLSEVVDGDIPDRISKTENGNEEGAIPGIQNTTEMLSEIIKAPMTTYTMTFPEGLSALHLPLHQAEGIAHFTDLFEALGGDNVNTIAALRPAVQIWTVVTSAESAHDEWISRHRGFIVDMETEVTLELVGVQRPYGYDMMYLREGMNLVGVPRQSESLQTVGDFYDAFYGVVSVKGLDPELDIDFTLPIQESWFIALDNDVEIDGRTAYMIETGSADQYPVWGVQWTQPVTASEACAPGAVRIPKTIFTTWGAVKGQ